MITTLKRNSSLTFYQLGASLVVNGGSYGANSLAFDMQKATITKRIGGIIESMSAVELTSSLVSQNNQMITDSVNSLVQNVIDRGLTYKNNELWSRRGYMAEEWHAGTYNLDSAINRSKSFAVTDKSTSDGSADITFDGDKTASLKYCKDAESSVKAQSNPKYGEQVRVIPGNQVDSGKEVLDAMMQNDKLKGRTEAKAVHESTKSKIADRIVGDDGTSSTPLSKEQGDILGKSIQKDGSVNRKAIDEVMEQTGVNKKIWSAKLRNELVGVGKIALIGAGIGFTIGFAVSIARQGITPDSLKYAIAEGGKTGLSTGAQSLVGYGLARTIGSVAVSAIKGVLMNSGIEITENIAKMCNMGVVGGLTIAVFSVVQFTRLLIKGESLKTAAIQIGKQALFSISLLALSIVAQGIWGGAAGIIVSVSTGIIIVSYSIAEMVHQRHFADTVREYILEKSKPIII